MFTKRQEGTPRKRRLFRWVFLAVQVAFLVWVVAGASTGHPANCGTLDQQTCSQAYDAGKGIGVAVLIALWVAVDVILGITYLIVRVTRR